MDSPTSLNQENKEPQIAFMRSVFLFAGLVSLGLGFYRWQASVVMGVIDFVFAFTTFSLVFYLNRHKEKIETISSIALVISYILFTAIYFLAPYNATRISLFFLLTASAFFLKGRQGGRNWLIVSLLTLLIGHFIPGVDTAYSHLEIITGSLYLLALFFIVLNYENYKDKAFAQTRYKSILRLSEERFRTLVESGHDIVAIISEKGSLRFISPSVTPLLGFTPDELLHQPFSALIHPDERQRADELLMTARTDSVIHAVEFRLRQKQGGYRDIELRGRNLVGNAVIGGIVLNGRDITEQKQARDRRNLTSKVFENTLEGIVITNADSQIIEVNHAACEMTGYTRDELIGQNPRIFLSGHHSHSFYDEMWQTVRLTGHWTGEIWNRKKNGEIYPEWLSLSAMSGEKGEVSHYVGISSDITLHKQYEGLLGQLEHVAHYDALTGLPNRYLLGDRMQQAVSRTAREENMMAVCYLDLDGFKQINDTLGHEMGDRVLIEVSQRIQRAIRGDDTVARLGGDEFVILLLGMERGDECSTTLARLLAAISEPLNIMEKNMAVSASIGVSIYPLDDEDADTLLRHADQAMYIAKQSGKNRFHIYDPTLDQRARVQHELLKQIDSALQRNEFVLHYQPKIDLHTQKLTGAEALIRWNHPELGLLSPAKFMPTVENTAYDIAIGEWVIATALRQVDEWRQAGLNIEISINISAHHLESEGFIENLQRQRTQYPALPEHCFQIEVLETAALADVGKVTRIIEDCQKTGVCFALDDFGTGYSSLSYLSKLPIDTLKIDQSFMRNLSQSQGDHAVVRGIIALSKAFDLETVAEGIETRTQFNDLLEMGCDIGQGYGIARPMPADALLAWAKKDHIERPFFSDFPSPRAQ